jgi:putative oxygen-independent coproporphyrinogen III oxidase
VPEPLGVYVHIPFCRRRCDYCAFATWTGLEALWERYVAACVTEASERLPTFERPATSVFFGGGTPSLLPAELLAQILAAVEEAAGLASGAEVTVECNPETVTASKLSAYRAAGVTRLSFGAQSMQPHVLASLGRAHRPESVCRAAELAGEAGFAGAYNIDLIFGAAGESVADWGATVEAALGLSPPPAHVSAYALTVEPGTPLSRDPARHPDGDDQADKYAIADALLQAAGYGWYEISNWALPGAECAHNWLYWSEGEYAGVGCAAHSHAFLAPTAGDGARSAKSAKRAKRWWNVRTPERYCRLVEAGRPAEAAGEVLGPDERAVEELMLSLRTRRGVPAEALPAQLFEAGLVERRWLSLAPEVRARGPVQGPCAPEERAVLTLRGRLLANEVSLRLGSVPKGGGA